nr:hypothetical protein [Tanacetum cinerariifolium]
MTHFRGVTDWYLEPRPAPLSPDRTPALYGYPLDFGDESLDEDLSDTAETLYTQLGDSDATRLQSSHEAIESCTIFHLETMTTMNQGMSFTKIEQIVAQRVAYAIETIAIYETKTRMARESTIQTKRREDKVAKSASNKRKWEVTTREALANNKTKSLR